MNQSAIPRKFRTLARKFYSLGDLKRELQDEEIEPSLHDIILLSLEGRFPVYATYLNHFRPSNVFKLPPETLEDAYRKFSSNDILFDDPNEQCKISVEYEFKGEMHNVPNPNMKRWKIEELLIDAETYTSLKREYLNQESGPRSKMIRSEKSDDLRGIRSALVREEIRDAAIYFLNEAIISGKASFVNPGKGTIAARLADEIHDQRSKWPLLKEQIDKKTLEPSIPYGTSHENIVSVIRQALRLRD